MSTPTFSFEFFPPKTPELGEELFEAMGVLAALEPKYMTVTYGAGGSTKEGTRKALQRAVDAFEIPMASHLTFLSTTKAELDEYIDSLWEIGVKHLVALRGDLPKGRSYDEFQGEEYHKFTSEFVAYILKRYPFEISVGAYPEKHPDAPSLDADIAALKLKCDAGASRAITQFFFDNDVYYRFLDQCLAAGITTPILPGLLPVHDFAGMCNFAGRCGADVPGWMHEKFDGASAEDAVKIATDLLIEQSLGLVKNGVDHIHYYTLNKAGITKQACEALGDSVG